MVTKYCKKCQERTFGTGFEEGLCDRCFEEKRAEDFLKKHDVLFSAVEAVPQTAPDWANKDGKHGIKWSITLRDLHINGKEIEFSFWSSISDKEKWEEKNCHSLMQRRHPKPSVYSVLAGLLNDTSGTFEDFCANYGYDIDSRAAENVFKACKALNAKLAKVFTPEALQELSEIQ